MTGRRGARDGALVVDRADFGPAPDDDALYHQQDGGNPPAVAERAAPHREMHNKEGAERGEQRQLQPARGWGGVPAVACDGQPPFVMLQLRVPRINAPGAVGVGRLVRVRR